MAEIMYTKRKRITQTATIVIITLIAICAIVLSVYAFKQKKLADEQRDIAEQKAVDVFMQHKIALEQKNIADSNIEQTLQQRELALENQRTALFQKNVADSETRKAELSRLEALKQQYLAEEQKINAENQKGIAEANALEAMRQQASAAEQRHIAKQEKLTSERLVKLTSSRRIANESVFLLNEKLFDSAKSRALLAYQLNRLNDGPTQNNDLYNALNSIWLQSIHYKNQFAIHAYPVHCLAISSNKDVIFTADEFGVLNKCSIVNNSLKKLSTYAMDEEIKALALSENNNKLAAITTAGNGVVFNVSSGIDVQNHFEFHGTGKAIHFYNDESFIVLSSEGIEKFNVSDMDNSSFINLNGTTAFSITGSGEQLTSEIESLSIKKYDKPGFA